MNDALWPILGGAITAGALKILDMLVTRYLKSREQADAADAKNTEQAWDESAAIRQELRQIERELRAENTQLRSTMGDLQRQNAELSARATFQDALIKAAAEREATRDHERQALEGQLHQERTARELLQRQLETAQADLKTAQARIADLEHKLRSLHNPTATLP
jgi:chromosome segregation ATPase